MSLDQEIINQLAYENLNTMEKFHLTMELIQILTGEFTRDKIESLGGKMQTADYVRLQDQLNRLIDSMGESKSALQKTYDWLREGKLPEIMESQELEGLRVEGVGRVHLQSDVRISVKADSKAEAYEWLGDNGHGGLIQQTVNASSLKAFYKGELKKGNELPTDLFNTSLFTRAVITRK
ncbi:hypothetical protein [Acinetobacter phage pB23]|nr:hypothetical protein [Acinetobacter phage pB23]